MNKGLAILEINDTGARSIFIDQDALECERLNARTEKRVARATEIKKEADRAKRIYEKQTARRRAYAISTVIYVLLCLLTAVGAVAGCVVGLIHPVVSVPVAILCLCVACLRLGVWVGKRGRYAR